jgi:hypothetical protein
MNVLNNKNIITSVIGFNLDVRITYTNEQGEEIPICKGCKYVPYTGTEKAQIGVSHAYARFFTNFNHELLNKIRDYQSKNY